MPGTGDYNPKKIIAAVQNGRFPREIARRRSVTEVLAVILKAKDCRKENASFDSEEHHALAREAGGESIVLLKNAENILPLNLKKLKKIAMIGAFAKTPRYQGSGSSQVNPTKVSNAYDELVSMGDGDGKFAYAAGYNSEGDVTESLLEEAREVAAEADVAVVFAGLPDSYESEGFDRLSLEMPSGHNQLIEAVSSVQAESRCRSDERLSDHHAVGGPRESHR